jgi:hypothetical protein
MPPKQTRESIEAELNASESDRLVIKLREVLSDLDEVEKELEALEEAQGLPAFYRSKPLLERMATVASGRTQFICPNVPCRPR